MTVIGGDLGNDCLKDSNHIDVLGEHIGNIIVRWNSFQHYLVVSEKLPHKQVMYVQVFCPMRCQNGLRYILHRQIINVELNGQHELHYWIEYLDHPQELLTTEGCCDDLCFGR